MNEPNKYPEISWKAERPDAVSKFLEERKKEKQLFGELHPKCCKIFETEIPKVIWMDECFERFMYEQLKGAHVSQLQSFVTRYKYASAKTVFFMKWIREEL